MTFMVLTLLALSWVTLDLRAPAVVTDGPQRGALQVFAPVQQALATLLSPVTAATGWIADQRGLHRELAELRTAAAHARSATVRNADLAGENRRLRALLSMRARSAHRTVGARVLGSPPGDSSGGVVITAGAVDGVETDAAVVNEHGLVGRIVATAGSHARAELVTSPTARYAVRVDGGRTGRLWGGRSLLRLELDDPHRAVPAGAAVVTRAFEGSSIPDGLPIGTVMADPVHDRYLDVRPLVDPATLDLVQVVVDGPAQPAAVVDGSDGRSQALPPPPRPGER